MLRHLDRYIFTRFLKSFFFVVILLGFVICVIDFTDKNDDFLEHKLPASTIFSYYLAFFPHIMSYITPITVFISTVFVTSRLAAHSEIIAILASGVSFPRLLVPYWIGSVCIGILSFYLYGWLVPNGNKYRTAFEVAYIKNPFYFKETNVHYKVGEDLYLYFKYYDNESGKAHKILLERFDNQELTERLYADYMSWDTLCAQWTLHNWRIRSLKKQGEDFSQGRTRDILLQITPRDFKSTYGLKEALTMPELDKHITLLLSRGDATVSIYEVEKYGRYMQPFAVLLLTFLGVLVSARKTREGTGLLIALGFLIAFVYIIFFVLAKSMAEVGTMHPMLGVWIPNIVFTFVSLLLYRTLPK